jgi:hypothetical protein
MIDPADASAYQCGTAIRATFWVLVSIATAYGVRTVRIELAWKLFVEVRGA